jgi:integrase
MRQGEILKMRWNHINFNTRSIRIPAENFKTKQERFIPIDANLAATLDSIGKKGDHVFKTSKRRHRQKFNGLKRG